MVRAKKSAAVLAAAMSVVLGVAVPASAAPSQAPSNEPLRIYLVNDQSVVDAIMEQAQQDPAYAVRAASWAERWRKDLNAGENPGLPGLEDASTEETLQEVADLKTRLAGVRKRASSTSPTGTPGVTVKTMTVTAAAVDRNNANTYPIRGAKQSNPTYWKMTLEGTGVSCDDQCETTDKYVAKLTINPGTNSTRINGSNLYFPNGGGFTKKLLQISAVCNGTICGRQTTGNLPNASSDVISNYGDRHGKVLTIGVALMLYHGSSYVWDAGKTHDCTGQAASAGNNCKYSY